MPTHPPHAPQAISGLRAIADRYDALLCDIWGVVHDGLRAHPAAVAALRAFRARGPVVLITNAPRPASDVATLLERMGAPPDCYDAIVTSGEVSAGIIADKIDQSVYHLGPDRDRGLFELAAQRAGRAPRLAPPDRADYVLCTGLFDDTHETPADYLEPLSALKARGLTFVCANPDRIVHRGEAIIYCAGALADEYRRMGGDTVVIGKPYRAIYESAFSAASWARPSLEKGRVLAIGDGVATDLKGAEDFGLDALFIAGGIHRDDIGDDGFAPETFAPLGAPPRYWSEALTP